MLAFIFGQGLRTQFIHRWAATVAAVGFVTLGLSGPFLAFATDLPGEPVSWHGLLHGIGFLLLMLGAAVTFGQVSFYRLVTVLLTWFAVMGLRLRQLASTTPPGF